MNEKPINVLLVESDKRSVELVRGMLAQAGGAFHLESVDRLDDGLERLNDGGTAVALVDLCLPDSHGLETLVKARARAQDVPIVALVGDGGELLRAHAMLEGAEDCLVKGGIDADVLSLSIRRAVERNGTKNALASSEARFRKVVERNADAALVVNREGIARFVNPAAEALFGRPAEELVGAHLGLPMVEAGSTEIDIVGRNGDTRTAEMRAVDIDWEGEPAHLVSMRDVTERKRAEEELKQRNADLAASNRELDEFAHVVSHDLKEPLRGIHNYSEYLNEDYGSVLDAEGVAKLETLARLADRMTRLIDSVLEYSRVGRQVLNTEPTDLNGVIDEVRESLGGALRAADVEVRVPAPLPTVLCDRVRIAEVLQNLISNAVKYNDKPEKWVEIACAQANEDTASAHANDTVCTVYVRDNGIGMAEKHLDRIFRIFKRLHAADKFGGGTGVGLTMAKKIVERHGGRIWVESVPGQGSTFYLTLREANR